MSDWADLAAAREQEQRDDALAEQARRSGQRQVETSAAYCAVCEGPIPATRRALVPGVQTCVECQRELERGLARAPQGKKP